MQNAVCIERDSCSARMTRLEQIEIQFFAVIVRSFLLKTNVTLLLGKMATNAVNNIKFEQILRFSHCPLIYIILKWTIAIQSTLMLIEKWHTYLIRYFGVLKGIQHPTYNAMFSNPRYLQNLSTVKENYLSHSSSSPKEHTFIASKSCLSTFVSFFCFRSFFLSSFFSCLCLLMHLKHKPWKKSTTQKQPPSYLITLV